METYPDKPLGNVLQIAMPRAPRICAPWATMDVVARRKLRQLEIAGRLDDLRCHPAITLKHSRVIVPVNTASLSTISGVSAFVGRMQGQKMWKSLITTEESP